MATEYRADVVVTLHARLGCPVILLAVCPKLTVATWCAAPIIIGHPDLTLTPLVLGPDAVPVIADVEAAKHHPELTVLSALEALMTTAPHRYQSDFARRYVDRGHTEGQAEGQATAVLAILDARRVDVPEEVRADIAGCTDLERLATWVRRAATATTVQDLFG